MSDRGEWILNIQVTLPKTSLYTLTHINLKIPDLCLYLKQIFENNWPMF